MRTAAATLLYVASLLLISYGCWLASPSAGLIVGGSLLWIDLQVSSLKKKGNGVKKKGEKNVSR